MNKSRNTVLEALLIEYGFSHEELAEKINRVCGEITGKPGSLSDRDIRRWVSGAVRWPTTRYLLALRQVFDRSPEAMGFIPRGKSSRLPDLPPTVPTVDREEESPVQRRTFLTATTGTTAAVVPALSSRPTGVGTSDVIELRKGLDALTALDQSKGGHVALEQASLDGAVKAIGLQDKAASQRIRQRLFSVAAGYTTTAAWSCIDARQLDRARAHLNEALRLAGLAQDPLAQMQVWNSTAILASQGGDAGESVAAAQAAQSTVVTRRDPLFGSLAHARAAIGQAQRGERQAALRSLGFAEEAIAKAEPQPRPGWVAFYGPAELLALAAIVHEELGEPVDAEAVSHQALAALPKEFRRNRAMVTAHLALAQLHQGDAEQACASAENVFTLMSGSQLPGRLRVLLGDFHRDLLTLPATAPIAREWGDRYRSEWSIT